MLEVEFEKIIKVTFLICNEGTFFSKKDFQLHSSFKFVSGEYGLVKDGSRIMPKVEKVKMAG